MEISVTERAISLPAEWAPQKAIWTAWPADADEWNGELETPRRDVAAMVRALSGGNQVRLLVNGPEAETSARASLGGAADILQARYGDIWLRDTGPVFAQAPEGAVALRFKTNGWGGKFDLPDDARAELERVAEIHRLSLDEEIMGFALAHVIEGDVDVAAQIVDVPAERIAKGTVLKAYGTIAESMPLRLICA